MPSRARLCFERVLRALAFCASVAAAARAEDGVQPPVALGAAAGKLTSQQLDVLIAAEAGSKREANEPRAATADEDFLRRASFDLIGRQPSPEEQQQFVADQSAERYQNVIERLLASEQFGTAWADYWSDTIAYRVPPPELTYLNYRPFKQWLSERLNRNLPWDETVRLLITATGKVEEAPAATFVGYHQADPTNLASETCRVFLGQQILCAQCHDHPFDHWKRAEFHELAAFFGRARSKLSQNDSLGTVVSAATKGEYAMSDIADSRKPGTEMTPTVPGGTPLKKGRDDKQRREQLAGWITAADNPWFSKAYTNRVWSRLMGRGFFEPVDDLGNSRPQLWPAVHQAVAAHFVASNHDVKDLFRLVISTEAYRHRVTPAGDSEAEPAGQGPLRLRGDEVFAALALGLDLPNFTPETVKPTGAVRFPPPPKSTRDLVNEAFGTDPSLSPADAPRTIYQALWMMNNEQLQKQINAAPDSGTMLAKLLETVPDDRAACEQLFARVLARKAREEEVWIALEHIGKTKDRRTAFEDLLWGLVNSAEFTSRR